MNIYGSSGTATRKPEINVHELLNDDEKTERNFVTDLQQIFSTASLILLNFIFGNTKTTIGQCLG